MVDLVRALRDRGPSDEELVRAKSGVKALLRQRAASSWGLAGMLDTSAVGGGPLDPCELNRRVDAVGASDVRAVMRMYFDESRFGVVVVARPDQLDEWPQDLRLGDVQRRDGFARDLP
jgi:predicted Zn-dependent peptidase